MQSAILLYQIRPSVRLSVRHTHTLVLYPTNAHIVKLCPQSGRGMTLIFLSATTVPKFRGEPPQRER